ncbi:MAG TPA: ABC transporter, partial [Lachnospiraceae bacterium]|nr:ABC transporter [Lachnospiraceae bacterium]
MILNCHDISKSYTGKSLFTGATFDINDKDKVALVGENGCGKTTLFRIILGLENADSGNVAFSKNVKTGYMAQIVSEKDESRSIFDILLSAKDEVIKLEESLREREKEIEALKEEGTDLNRISDVLTLYDTDTKRFEEMGGLTYLNEVYSVMHGLGFTDEDKDRALNELSGGQKTRVFLGNLLLQKPDILFLDEPTNHLDVNTLSFLEDYLKSYDRAVFVISHDRYFLDKIVNKVIDIDNEKVSVYTGNYSQYSEKKKEALKAMQKAYENDQQMRRHEEEVIKKLKSFNREKSIKRAESREKLLEKKEVVEKPMTDDERMRLTFTPALRSGNDVLKVHDIKKSFGDNNLFEGLSFEIKRGEHVALIGDNGTGKSTILKL